MIAKNGEKVIGFAGYGAYRDAALPGHGEIYGTYVLKEYHGLKVRYTLMNIAFQKLTNYKKIALWVLKGNQKAIRFYEQYGFQFDGITKEIILAHPTPGCA